MPDQDDLGEIFTRMQADHEAKDAKAFADMFIHPAICRHCGAQVAIPEAHKAFHDDLTEFAKSVNQSFERVAEVAGMKRSGPTKKARPADV